jgi:hypothetical protein
MRQLRVVLIEALAGCVSLQLFIEAAQVFGKDQQLPAASLGMLE